MKESTPIWQMATAEDQMVERLQGELKIHGLLARILAARGVQDRDEGQRFIEPRLADLHPPQMAGLELAVERMGQAIEGGERIGVFGDYDVDGVTSTALIGDYLALSGADVVLRVARRDEGYGFSVAHAEEMKDRGVALLMLVDCGTSDHEAVACARDSGLDVLALDHHQVTREEWPGMALINPQRVDCPFPYKGLASVGLAFYFIAALRRLLQQRGLEATDPREFLDLVALGTIADVAPLDGDNRILVASGLQQLRRTERPGLRELLRLCHIADRALTSTDVGWQLGPRLNAPGRMGDASTSLECLRLGAPEERRRCAKECHTINEERKEIQGRILEAALEQARDQLEAGATFLLLEGEDWHPGVIGIVASKIVDTFRLPAGIIALEGERGRGSARSVPGFNLIEALSKCSAYMEKFGGHHGAAGFSLGREQNRPPEECAAGGDRAGTQFPPAGGATPGRLPEPG